MTLKEKIAEVTAELRAYVEHEKANKALLQALSEKCKKYFGVGLGENVNVVQLMAAIAQGVDDAVGETKV